MKFKSALCAFLCAVLLITTFYVPVQAASEQVSPFDGQGTEDAPYLIENVQQMWALARLVNAGDGHYAGACYRLTANIDLGPADWVPIGRVEATPFRGVFDGDGYAVTGMRGDDFQQWKLTQLPELEYTDPETMTNRLPDHVLDQLPVGGLFGVTQGAVIDDLYVEGDVFGLRYCGGLVGWARDSQIRNCVVRARLLFGRQAFGGIVGKSEGSLIENSCYFPEYTSLDLVDQRDKATCVVNCFSAGRQSINGDMENRSNHYYRGDGSHIQTWEQHYDIGQETVAVSVSELGQELNAWVDDQEPGKYRRWRTPGEPAWPVLADHFVTLGEEPLPDEEERFWFQSYRFGGVKGDRIDGTGEALVYAAMDGRPPRLTGLLDGIEGFQVNTLCVDGHAITPDHLPIVDRDMTLDVSYRASGNMDAFTMTAPAIDYPDVPADAWYGANKENVVADVTRLGLFVGRDDGRFAPEEPLLLCEAVKLAAVVRSIYTADGHVFDQTAGEHWFDTYKTYVVDHGLMYDWELDDLERPATRLETAYLLGGALPSWELSKIAIAGNKQQFTPPDIKDESRRYFWTIFGLYYCGALQGADQNGSFYPDRAITRAETAAILTRLVLPERRLVFTPEI